MNKLITNIKAEQISRKQQKTILAGLRPVGDECGPGEYHCFCNREDYGCVTSLSDCSDKC